MTNQQFIQETKQFFEECLKTMDAKGSEYSGSDDKFANFKRLATRYGVPIEEIWAVYFTKHLDAIESFVIKRREGHSVTEIENGLTEPITGRIMDAINYLFILKGILDEERENELEKEKCINIQKQSRVMEGIKHGIYE